MFMRGLLGAALLAAAASQTNFIPANDPRLKWVGRRFANGSSYAIDWELTSVSITVTNATVLYAQITDWSEGGARFAVFLNNTATYYTVADPNPDAGLTPDLRVATLVTDAGSKQYALGSRGGISGQHATWRLVLLTEPQFIRDNGPQYTLQVDGFVTDGIVVQAPALSTRRIEFLGDSLTAGYGSGFEQTPPAAFPHGCGAGLMINDAANSYGAVLCSNFSADCQIEAVSGITLYTGHPNLPDLWPYELGSMYSYWGNAKVPFDASRWVPDAVVINLGENDWNGNCGNSPSCINAYSSAYVAFVQSVAKAYGRNSIVYFATIAPHEKGQSAGILPAVATLQGLGVNIHFLNATVPESQYPPGCGGHPGPTIHRAAATRAQPVIAAAMGW